MVVCLSTLALHQARDLSRVYPASCPMVDGIGSPLKSISKENGWMGFKEIKKSISVTETLFRLLRDNLLFLSNLKNTLKSFYWNCFLAKKQSLF